MNKVLGLVSIILLGTIAIELVLLVNSNQSPIIVNKKLDTKDINIEKKEVSTADTNWQKKVQKLMRNNAIVAFENVVTVKGTVKEIRNETGKIADFNYNLVFWLNISNGESVPFYFNEHDLKVLSVYNNSSSEKAITLESLVTNDNVKIKLVTDSLYYSKSRDKDGSTKSIEIYKIN